MKKWIDQINGIILDALELENRFEKPLKKVSPTHQKSVLNLLHYLAMRRDDIRELQNELGRVGISRLGKAESHVMASLIAVRRLLYLSAEVDEKIPNVKSMVSFDEGKELLRKHAQDLLGPVRGNRQTRMMVTLPTEAAEDKLWIESIIDQGVEAVRINCAHDGPEVWLRMIRHVRKISAAKQVTVKIAMDLGGPKLRTGPIKPGPAVIRVKPFRDSFGKVIRPARICLETKGVPTELGENMRVPVRSLDEVRAKPGEQIMARDARGKKRRYWITRVEPGRIWMETDQTTYFVEDMPLQLFRDGKGLQHIFVDEIEPEQGFLLLKEGDLLVVHKEETAGEGAEYDRDGDLISPAHISCAIPEVYKSVQPGELILLDDGKIRGRIESVFPEKIHVRIRYAGLNGVKLRADKGINLPDTDLKIRGLTKKDREDLKFVAEHADVVNMSFVNYPEDVKDLLSELDKLKAKDRLGIILKIETKRAFENLSSLLMVAMRHAPIGVMMARGDLAVECGWNHLARVQEEMLRLCEAAHIPQVWATQVLESLAKRGLPSRAEITDAAIAQRTECVMLNKGPFISKTIKLLDRILQSMRELEHKKAPMLPRLKTPEVFDL